MYIADRVNVGGTWHDAVGSRASLRAAENLADSYRSEHSGAVTHIKRHDVFGSYMYVVYAA